MINCTLKSTIQFSSFLTSVQGLNVFLPMDEIIHWQSVM